MRLYASAILLVIGVLLSGCSENSLPKIEDVDALRKECAILSPVHVQSGHGDQSIPKEQWPASVKALHPMMVSRGEFGVSILIKSSEKDQLSILGYYVFDDSQITPPTNSPATRPNDQFYFGKPVAKGVYEIVRPSSI